MLCSEFLNAERSRTSQRNQPTFAPLYAELLLFTIFISISSLSFSLYLDGFVFLLLFYVCVFVSLIHSVQFRAFLNIMWNWNGLAEFYYNISSFVPWFSCRFARLICMEIVWHHGISPNVCPFFQTKGAEFHVLIKRFHEMRFWYGSSALLFRSHVTRWTECCSIFKEDSMSNGFSFWFLIEKRQRMIWQHFE